MPARRAFADLLVLARRAARRSDEADDLLQSALLAALESGRTDLSSPETQRWLAGVIRKQGAFDARTSARRRRREARWSADGAADCVPDFVDGVALDGLAPSLRITALLAINGCTRQDIGWLLNLSDTALRQRLSQLGRALRRTGAAPPQPRLCGGLPFGVIRRALLAAMRQPGAVVASHDPDGHLFVMTRSQTAPLRQQDVG